MPALALLLWAILVTPVPAQVAPDATGFGPFDTTSAEYKFPAATDPDVLTIRPTELWAVVYRPQDLSQGPYPLLVFLHGNHGTCGYGENPRIDDSVQYTFDGTCPANHVVTPNHLGYTYIAEQLASWGYIVVSINSNRGINGAGGTAEDLGLNQARGKLLLKHLQRLSEWNQNGGTPDSLGVELQGKLNFSHVGLLGHSRGGEGVRAAYNFYRDPGSPWPGRIGPVTFEGIFEIGPVDGQTNRLFIADGTPWNVLLPMCDGDVSNLQGIRALDRMMLALAEDPARQKSNYTVWGANHNYYNTEWQTSDSTGCIAHDPLWSTTVGSPEQRQTGLASVMAFFRGNVGTQADPSFNENFNPQFGVPDIVSSVTRVDRGFTDSPNSNVTLTFEDFDKPTGTNSYGVPNDASNITIKHSECTGNPTTPCPLSVPNHNTGDVAFYGPRFGQQQTAAISWTAAGSNTYFQTNWKPTGQGTDITGFQTLDLRISRRCMGLVTVVPSCDHTNPLNTTDSTNFSIRLVQANGDLSDPVPLNAYTDLTGPVGGMLSDGTANLHPILQTVRIPLGDFANVNLTQIRGVRLTFDDTPTGAIYVANIRLSTLTGLKDGTFAAAGVRKQGASGTMASASNITTGKITRIHRIGAALALAGEPGVEIEVTSDTGFPVRNELAVLRIGSQLISVTRYPDNGDTHTLIFTLSDQQFALTNSGDEVWVQYGVGEPNVRWSFGRLNKTALEQ